VGVKQAFFRKRTLCESIAYTSPPEMKAEKARKFIGGNKELPSPSEKQQGIGQGRSLPGKSYRMRKRKIHVSLFTWEGLLSDPLNLKKGTYQ